MMRDRTRSSFSLVLSGLLLAACGVAPEPGLAPTEPLGTREAAMCSGTSVSALDFYGISTYQGEMAGNGGWAVSGGANAIYLDYYVDGALYSSELRMGLSGTWYFSQGGISCGSHLFEVKASPAVIDSSGNQTYCWMSGPRALSQYVQDETCAPPASGGNPFRYVSASDQRQGCYGIAGRNSASCASISDFNDRQMCYGLATASQQPCTSMTDRNMQLACYGMSIKYPSNCRDITDANMQAFCYGVSYQNGTYCNSITDRNTQLFCYGMSNRIGSNCRDITNANDRQFCYGVSSSYTSDCAYIQ
ncbi:MAG TPA: hypothetical protein VFZ09_47355 [Archangium sp.]|uniref:hypothetical protein n=1 Tax=Archangium sp. TaxID=1872627 RepID=UPI002E35B8AB|nr:hypothetical protein [Archangium sp.]HEX5753893.1 hypothetical protein [Archangium sp.]